jgi:hypothetical protein
MLEKQIRECSIKDGNRIAAEFRPYEIKTFRIKREPLS